MHAMQDSNSNWIAQSGQAGGAELRELLAHNESMETDQPESNFFQSSAPPVEEVSHPVMVVPGTQSRPQGAEKYFWRAGYSTYSSTTTRTRARRARSTQQVACSTSCRAATSQQWLPKRRLLQRTTNSTFNKPRSMPVHLRTSPIKRGWRQPLPCEA